MPSQKKPAPETPPAEVHAAGSDSGGEDGRALLRFMDVPVGVSVELARKKVKVADILNLQVDSVIEMEQSAGENVDLRLNGVAVGTGEIVVIEDMMGLRITDLKARPIDHD